MSKRLRWFERGALALAVQYPGFAEAALGPDAVSAYVCPLCGRAFNRLAVAVEQLTLEDVPPKSAGGRPLVLTCKPCDSVAGSTLDAHAHRRENIIAVMRNEPVGPRYVTAQVADERVQGHLTIEHGGIKLELPKHLNREDAPLRFAQRAANRETFTIGFDGDRHSELGANISWLKSAYSMFAIFGYAVVVAPAHRVVRQQVLESMDRIIVSWTITLPERIPLTARRVLWVQEPAELACWAVQFGPYAVMLPEPSDMTFYDRIASRVGKGGEERISGRSYEFPSEPFFGL